MCLVSIRPSARLPALFATLLAASLCPPLRAAPLGWQALSDHELSRVSGQADATRGRAQGVSTAPSSGLPGGLSDALQRSVQAKTVSDTDFQLSWQLRSGQAWPTELTVAERVTQMSFQGGPITVETPLIDWLAPGSKFNSQASLGTLTLKALDLRGTTLWLWTH